MNPTPIHVSYAPKLAKSKTRQILKEYIFRFYTPFAFLAWTMVALNLNSCSNVPYILIFISLLAASVNSYQFYAKWERDHQILADASRKIPRTIKINVASTHFVIQFACSFLSFWWIDDFHTCVPFNRNQQGVLWFIGIAVTFVAHIFAHKVANRKLVEILSKYATVSDEV